MDIQLILADAAQASAGKVHMLGAGWSVTGSPTSPSAVVGLIKVPWDRANETLTLRLNLVNEDGQPVHVANLFGADGPQEIAFGGTIEVGRPAGLKAGTPIDSSFVIPIPSLPLTPGRYTWNLDLSDVHVSSSFTVVAAQPG